jgi:hypothetical protein
MCYLVYLSTTSPADLRAQNTERIAFEGPRDDDAETATSLLAYPHRWYVSWMGGCSCGLRHVVAAGLGFGPPEDWCPEDDEEIENTGQLYRVIRALLSSGHAVDCLDIWTGTGPEEVVVVDVALADIPEAHFRLFEGHLFRFAVTAG